MIFEEYFSCVVKLLNFFGMSWIVCNYSYVWFIVLILCIVVLFYLILLCVIKIMMGFLFSKGFKIYVFFLEGWKY